MPKRTLRKKIGIFGGAFNPVHLGHLAAARAAKEALKLDEVWFLPCAKSAFGKRLWPARLRVKLLKTVLQGHRDLKLSTVEVDRGGVSYMVDTLREIRQKNPRASLWLVIGADAAEHLSNWKQASELPKLAKIAVVTRPGKSYKYPKNKFFSLREVKVPLYEISSTEIRSRLEKGKDIRWMVPSIILSTLSKNFRH